MGIKVIGSVNLGFVLIAFNYLLSWVLAIVYGRIAADKFDPLAARAAAAIAGTGSCDEHHARHFHRHSPDHARHHLLGGEAHARPRADFYAADSRLTAAQNGFALAGDWCSAAAFLGFTGLTALYGMDGAFYALGPLVAFCTVLFLIAEPLRNTGKYTLGDVIRSRMQTRTSLLAAIAGTVVVNFAYLMPQMAGAGVLVRLLTGISYDWAVIFVGVSMIVYVAFGGMLATTWVQIVKAVLMLSAGAIILVMILSLVHFNPLTLFAEAEAEIRRQLSAARAII